MSLDAAARLPLPLESYADGHASLTQMLLGRIQADPFNLAAAGIFFLAIVHTFLAGKFRRWAHDVEAAHRQERGLRRPLSDRDEDGSPDEISFKGQILHFFGEVEVIFGLWVIVLLGAITVFKGWATALDYIGHRVVFTEPMFVVVIMAMAATRPVLRLAEQGLRAVAALGRESTAAWWLAILIIAPLLGSFITEPAAMTIAALLLARQFYELKPSRRFGYATIGLLFVNISVGGTLTHFAAPPVLMVAAPWQWDMAYLFTHFGWKAMLGVIASSLLYYAIFRQEFAALDARRVQRTKEEGGRRENDRPVPAWITATQVLFMAFVVGVAHYPALFIGAFLVFLGFLQATAHHQSKLDLKPSLLVGFFLAGLVIHGGLQGWWIEPVLKSLDAAPLFLAAIVLTAFNDNAAITYLATLVPDFTEPLKYAVVAGAVTGGGLTVIANAPNPAGQTILQRFFPGGVAPLALLLAALPPTAIVAACFWGL